MRLFVFVCLSALVAVIGCWSVIYAVETFAYGQALGSSLFFITMTALVLFTKSNSVTAPAALVGAPLAFVAGTVLMTFVSVFVYEQLPVLLRIFAAPMDVLGYYPPGPDMYFPYAAAVWFISMLALIFSSLWLGLRLRTWKHGISVDPTAQEP